MANKRRPYLAGKGKPILIGELPWKKYDEKPKPKKKGKK